MYFTMGIDLRWRAMPIFVSNLKVYSEIYGCTDKKKIKEY